MNEGTLYVGELLSKKDQENASRLSFEKSKGTFIGAGIGLTAGTLYAFFKKKSYIPSMLIGTLAGGLVSSLFLYKN